MKYYKVTWLCNSDVGSGEKNYIRMEEVGLFFIDETHQFFELLKRCQKYDTKYNQYFQNDYIGAICNCQVDEISENEYTVCKKLFDKPFYFSGTADQDRLSNSEETFDNICKIVIEQMEQIDEMKDEIKKSQEMIENIYKECKKSKYRKFYPPSPIYFTRYEKYLLNKKGLEVEKFCYSVNQLIRLMIKIPNKKPIIPCTCSFCHDLLKLAPSGKLEIWYGPSTGKTTLLNYLKDSVGHKNVNSIPSEGTEIDISLSKITKETKLVCVQEMASGNDGSFLTKLSKTMTNNPNIRYVLCSNHIYSWMENCDIKRFPHTFN